MSISGHVGPSSVCRHLRCVFKSAERKRTRLGVREEVYLEMNVCGEFSLHLSGCIKNGPHNNPQLRWECVSWHRCNFVFVNSTKDSTTHSTQPHVYKQTHRCVRALTHSQTVRKDDANKDAGLSTIWQSCQSAWAWGGAVCLMGWGLYNMSYFSGRLTQTGHFCCCFLSAWAHDTLRLIPPHVPRSLSFSRCAESRWAHCYRSLRPIQSVVFP